MFEIFAWMQFFLAHYESEAHSLATEASLMALLFCCADPSASGRYQTSVSLIKYRL